MTNHFSIIAKKALKFIKIDKLFYYLRSHCFVRKVAVPVEKDLSSLPPMDELLLQCGVEIVAITRQALLTGRVTTQSLTYSDDARYRTALNYLDKGYRGVALIRGNEVVGDIWYASSCSAKQGAVHPDLKWLRKECGIKDAYAFDMYLPPGNRGKNLANLLQSGALHEIRRSGHTKALGYYWAENIPALWVHRTLRWKELERVEVSRFFCFHLSHELEVQAR